VIPKIIWQTHNNKFEDLPDNFIKAGKTWQNLNPGWEYKYFSEEERNIFVKKYSPHLYESYEKGSLTSQSDLWRYLVTYEFGGVYADMDSVCVKPLDYMLEKYDNQDLIFLRPYAQEIDHKGLSNNSHFAAVKKSKILFEIIKMIEIFHKVKQYKVEDVSWISYIIVASFYQQPDGKDLYFDAELHSHALKELFFDFRIDYYGSYMKYSDYLKNILKLNDIDFKNSMPSGDWSNVNLNDLPPAKSFIKVKEIGNINVYNMNGTIY
jgi:hypothetical protein